MNVSLPPENDEIQIDVLAEDSVYSPPEIVTSVEAVRKDGDVLISFHPAFPLVLVSALALAKSINHAQSQLDREIGGLCAGQVYRLNDADGQLIIRLEEVIIAEHTVAGDINTGAATLTFTPDSWSQLITQFITQYSGSRLVGWYHSHPGFGIFLSGMDLFIHMNYFPEQWHIAVVIDPIRRHFGVFARAATFLCSAILEFDDAVTSFEQVSNSLPMVLRPNSKDDEEPAIIEVISQEGPAPVQPSQM